MKILNGVPQGFKSVLHKHGDVNRDEWLLVSVDDVSYAILFPFYFIQVYIVKQVL